MSGTVKENGAVLGHMPFSAEDFAYFDWAIGRFRSGAWKTPDIYAFEYGGIGPAFEHRSDAGVIAEQVPVLVAKVRSLNK